MGCGPIFNLVLFDDVSATLTVKDFCLSSPQPYLPPFLCYGLLRRFLPLLTISSMIRMIDIKGNCGAVAMIRISYSKKNHGKLYFSCIIKIRFRLKLKEQNRRLKFYLV
uniref:Uncharacterized protein n=1 Tax=Lactuca sativa TaxID=4236 RepID=A0A9R1XGS1_LACSA|nr:hypothetical protein LSAT_V11C500284640 [Lactuca sativa]